MDNPKEILLAKDDSGLWALVEELKARRAARGVKEPEGPPLFVQKFRKRLEERRAKQQQLSHTFLALFEPMASNGFRAVCPTIENCTVEAPTREEAKTALIGEIKQRLRARLQAGKSLPTERGSAEMVEVALGES